MSESPPEKAPHRPSTVWRPSGTKAVTEGIAIAWDAMSANKLRSMLTILGVAVGVSVVVAIAALVTGLRSSVMDAFDSSDPNNFIVTRMDFSAVQLSDLGNNRPPWWNRPPIVPEEVRRIARLPTVSEAIYLFQFEVAMGFESHTVNGVLGMGFSAGWPAFRPGNFIAGRNFTPAEVEHNKAVVVLSSQLATEFFGQRDPVGRKQRPYAL